MNEDRYIYIVLSHTGSAFASAIKRFSDAKYTHASIASDEEFYELYSFGRIWPRNPFIGGFVKEDVERGTFSRFKNTEIKVYRIPVTEKQYERYNELLDRFKESPKDYKYNLLGVLALKFGKELCRDNRYFCSHFVAEMLEESGIIRFDKKTHWITPMDIDEKARNLQPFYTGKMTMYIDNFRTVAAY